GTNLVGTGFSEVQFGNSAFSSLIVFSTTHDSVQAIVPADATNGPVRLRANGGEATGPNFTLAPGGLKLLSWDVHQGMPEYQKLVAGKSTVLRLFLGSDAPDTCAYVSGVLLEIQAPGGQLYRYAH